MDTALKVRIKESLFGINKVRIKILPKKQYSKKLAFFLLARKNLSSFI
jgi:hypothetical protein